MLGKNIGGVERYVEKVVELVPSLRPQHQFVVFITRQATARFAGDERPNVKFVTLPVSDPILQRSIALPLAVRRHRLDVLQVQRIAPWACGRCRILLTVHDLIPLKLKSAYPGWRDRLIRLLTPGSVARADFIVSPTQTVCDEIRQAFPGIRAPTRPFYSGVDATLFRNRRGLPDRGALARYGLERGFVFSPGSIEARRNIETIVAALAQLEPASRPQLILSGSIRDQACFARIQDLAQRLGVADRVRHLGFVSEDDLVDLYAAASVCIAASRDEGFNLLPLESMACGTPVICSDIAVHRELFHGAAIFFPPEEPEQLADRLRDIQRGGAAGPTPSAIAACVDRLSWEATAERMASFYDEMAVISGATPPA